MRLVMPSDSAALASDRPLRCIQSLNSLAVGKPATAIFKASSVIGGVPA